jgi:type VI secretion system protein ImpE
MTAQELFSSGDLTGALAAAVEEVKQKPADLGRRVFLAELLCFTGNVDRADVHLDALAEQDPQTQYNVSVFRQLVRAEQARQQCFAEGRVPEFLGPVLPRMQAHLEAAMLLREGRTAEAAASLQQAESLRPSPTGTLDGQPFDEFRDMDDLTSSFLEVYTVTGKYYWVPIEQVELIEFREPKGARDLLWRRTHLIVRDGPDGEVFLPTTYPGTQTDADDRLRLARLTDWRGERPVRGVGQRMFLVGDRDLPILELKTIEFNPCPGEQPG